MDRTADTAAKNDVPTTCDPLSDEVPAQAASPAKLLEGEGITAEETKKIPVTSRPEQLIQPLIECHEWRTSDRARMLLDKEELKQLKEDLNIIKKNEKLVSSQSGEPEMIQVILDILDHRYIIPDFQRCWTWPATYVSDLFESVVDDRFIPQIVAWEQQKRGGAEYNDDPNAGDGCVGVIARELPIFHTSALDVNAMYSRANQRLILDGQQRLCALAYLVIYDGAIPVLRKGGKNGGQSYTPRLLAYSLEEKQLEEKPSAWNTAEASHWGRDKLYIQPKGFHVVEEPKRNVRYSKLQHVIPEGHVSARDLLVNCLLPKNRIDPKSVQDQQQKIAAFEKERATGYACRNCQKILEARTPDQGDGNGGERSRSDISTHQQQLSTSCTLGPSAARALHSAQRKAGCPQRDDQQGW